MTKQGEGWLLIDNRHAPGPDGTTFLEAAVLKCSHCEAGMLRNPSRTREREWCFNCDKYICDRCAAVRAVAGCKTYKAFLHEHEQLTLANLARQREI